MISILVFSAGLIVGWNFLPQPKWVRLLVDLGISKIKQLIKKQD